MQGQDFPSNAVLAPLRRNPQAALQGKPAEKHSPAVSEAKKQALDSIDLLKYKLERQYKKFGNMLKSKKMRKAKELEDISDYDFD